MKFLIFTCSLVFIYFNHFVSKNLRAENPKSHELNKRLFRLLKLVKFAPVIAFFILIVLVSITLHTKPGIRLSHAWFVSQFWAYSTLLYSIYKITKNKLSLVFVLLSIIIAIYNTPLFHYEHLFLGHSVIVSDIFGTLLFLSMWLTVSKMNTYYSTLRA
ncbi:hypothetical protein [Gottfriedia luciferensis]|uniref:hypothetical protein n=1 Tax=Gottfriedia luciferensis TaxID=178774 RepID=UPI000B443C93|nr:hypothetical protein [Gottfriedia luciferensis]